MTPSRAALADEIAAFAEKITPANARWEYALESCRTRDGHFVVKSFPALARLISGSIAPASVGFRLDQIQRYGSVDAARTAFFARPHRSRSAEPYAVGPIEPWQIGHVYFARVKAMPHIVKVGFSRRVRDRIEDIESKSRAHLDVFATIVGTAADEQWWHHDWRKLNITGEWFFEPKSTDRTLPAFLTKLNVEPARMQIPHQGTVRA